MADADVIVVGAGHNGLICAAYLARAGYEVLLVENRSSVGGCASTVEDLGVRFNICNCDHTLIRAMPMIDELDLASHGLTYLENDVSSVQLFHDGADPWLMFLEAERTIESIQASFPSQVDAYRRYLTDALPVAELVVELAKTTPTMTKLALGTAGRRSPAASARLLDWSRRSAEDVLGQYFDDWHLVMPAISVGPTVWGVSPSVKGTGLAALGYATRHLIKTGRPAGGSGALTDAVASSFRAAGGQIRCDTWVDRLLVNDGAVTGIGCVDGTTLTASKVVAACDPQRVFLDWISEPPVAARRLVDRWRTRPVQDGYESKVDAVLSARPTHAASGRLSSEFSHLDLLGPTTVVSPSPAQLAEAHRLQAEGRVADRPTLLVNMPSVTDPTMVGPAGGGPADERVMSRDVLSLEVLFTPYALEGGWQGSDEPDRWLDVWNDTVAPGGRAMVSDWRAMTPDVYERDFAMHRGHTPAFSGSPLSTLVGKQPELTRHRTPINGLYLCGAGTYPGAGIFGASGRHAFTALQHDDSDRVRRRRALLRR